MNFILTAEINARNPVLVITQVTLAYNSPEIYCALSSSSAGVRLPSSLALL